MIISKDFNIGDEKYNILVSTYKEANPYKLYLCIRKLTSSGTIYFWLSHENSSLKIFTERISEAEYIENLSIREVKRKILKCLTNS